MRPAWMVFCVAAAAAISDVRGAGFAHDENFTVLAPSQELAEQVLKRADQFRGEVAKQWFGEELPPGVGRAVIHVELSPNEDSGMTWAIDSPQRKFHKVWLTTNLEHALGSTLRHEITHVVFATWFPDRLPVWAEEGCASLSDNADRVATRGRIIDWYARSGNFPDLASLFDQETVAAHEKATYAVAASVTEMLISRGGQDGERRFIKFAAVGKKRGWEHALSHHYNLDDLADLQATWEQWIGQERQSVATSSK